MDEVKQIFRPEFLNRIDEIIVFHSLGKEEMKKIVSLLCNQFTKRLESQMNIHLKLRESAKALIVEKGTDAKYGARPLRRALQTELEDKLVPGTGRNRLGASDLSVRLFLSSRPLQLRRQPRPARSLSSEGHTPDSSDAGHHSLRAYSPVLLSRQTPLLQPHLQLPVGWPSPVSSQSVSSLSLISSALHPVLAESGTLLQLSLIHISEPTRP